MTLKVLRVTCVVSGARLPRSCVATSKSVLSHAIGTNSSFDRLLVQNLNSADGSNVNVTAIVAGSHRFCFGGFRRRTPGPPPFSSMNSMPAASKVRRIARSLAAVRAVGPSANSALRIVATPTEDSFARSSARQRIRDRAARIWPLVRARFMVDNSEDHMIN
jgi:hypothetical protein